MILNINKVPGLSIGQSVLFDFASNHKVKDKINFIMYSSEKVGRIDSRYYHIYVECENYSFNYIWNGLEFIPDDRIKFPEEQLELFN